MSKATEKQIEAMREKIIKDGGGAATALFYIQGDVAYKDGNNACHASMDYERVQKSPIIGNGLTNRSESEVVQDFLEWLVSKDSVYYPIIKYLGDDFHVVRNSANKIVGYFTTKTDVNSKVLQNFFKAIRTAGEHKGSLPFWEKWKMGKGAHPGLTYLLMYFVDTKGNKVRRGHSAIEAAYADSPIDVYVFANNNHDKWDMKASPINKGNTYYGESAYMWQPNGGRKGTAMHKLPIIKKSPLTTKYCHLYEPTTESNYSDETLENFYQNAAKFF